MKAGQVRVWLDQGPAVLLEQCDVEVRAYEVDELIIEPPETERGWIIHLLQTGELLTVHEETLN